MMRWNIVCLVRGHDWSPWNEQIFFKSATYRATRRGFYRWCRRCQQEEWK